MANQNISNFTQSWNNGATDFNAIKCNVTNLASAAASKLIDLQVGSASKFNVAKNGDMTLTNDDAGAAAGPVITLYRDSASPAASDILGKILFQGEDDAGNTEDYAEIYGTIADATSTSEDGSILMRAKVAGTMTTLATLSASGLALSTALAIASGGTGATDAAGARTALGLEIGANVQAYDAGLTSIAGLTTAADKMIYTSGSDTYSVTDLSAFARMILDDADASAVRTTLGLGTVATQAASSVSISGGTISGITDLAVADGGTGASTAEDARTNLGLVIGTDVQAYDADTAKLDVEDQTLTGGARVTSKSLGTVSSGTVTLDPGDRPLQHYTNGGAHTLAPGANTGSILLDITNNGSAGSITTSGWTKVVGDAFTTTNGHKFRCHGSVGDTGSLLVVQAMQ